MMRSAVNVKPRPGTLRNRSRKLHNTFRFVHTTTRRKAFQCEHCHVPAGTVQSATTRSAHGAPTKSAFAGIALQAATYVQSQQTSPVVLELTLERSLDEIHVRLSNTIQARCMKHAQTGDPEEPVSQARTPYKITSQGAPST